MSTIYNQEYYEKYDMGDAGASDYKSNQALRSFFAAFIFFRGNKKGHEGKNFLFALRFLYMLSYFNIYAYVVINEYVFLLHLNRYDLYELLWARLKKKQIAFVKNEGLLGL